MDSRDITAKAQTHPTSSSQKERSVFSCDVFFQLFQWIGGGVLVGVGREGARLDKKSNKTLRLVSSRTIRQVDLAACQILVGHKYSCPSELSPGSFSPVLRFPVAVPLLVPFPRPGPILLTLGAKALKLHVLRNTCSVGNTFLIVCSMGQDDVLVPRLHRVTLPHHFRE